MDTDEPLQPKILTADYADYSNGEVEDFGMRRQSFGGVGEASRRNRYFDGEETG